MGMKSSIVILLTLILLTLAPPAEAGSRSDVESAGPFTYHAYCGWGGQCQLAECWKGTLTVHRAVTFRRGQDRCLGYVCVASGRGWVNVYRPAWTYR